MNENHGKYRTLKEERVSTAEINMKSKNIYDNIFLS